MSHRVSARLGIAFALSGLFGLVGCGAPQGAGDADVSNLEWVKSRTNSTQYAYLESRDLADTFIFGASVIGVDDFISSALNMVIRPTNVKLRTRTTGGVKKLDVLTADANQETLLSFNTKAVSGKTEIDFASAGNDVQLRGLIDAIGGIYTAGDMDGYWVSSGAPRVLKIQQDADTLVVDLLHTIRQAVLKTDIFGNQTIDHFVSDHAGKVTIRVFLKRKKTLARINRNRKVADGLAKSVGYFGPDLGGESNDVQIQRFAIGDAQDASSSITFYLKDVPAEFKSVAQKAILSWNAGFGNGSVIKVADAPASLDAGDPRFNVVKWFNGLDDEIGWAGVAKMIVEPDTGLVMGGNLYLNGGSVLEMYKGITDFSQRMGAGGLPILSGTLGNVRFDRDPGEKPVVPYLSDLTQNYASYMQGYYLETIAHEVGHVLGLRHNFRGSTELTANESASVMDYSPRAERAHYKGPGRYDVAAIRWGYFGEAPRGAALPFCTDEDIWKFYDCSQGDWGAPEKSAIYGLLDGTLALTKKPIEATEDVLVSSLTGALENALKIKKFSAQLPAATRADTLKKIDAAYNYLYTAAPDAALTAPQKAIVEKNLARVRELAKKKEDELRAAGNL